MEQAKSAFEAQLQQAYAAGIEQGAKMALAGFAEKYGLDPIALVHKHLELQAHHGRLWVWACAQQDRLNPPEEP